MKLMKALLVLSLFSVNLSAKVTLWSEEEISNIVFKNKPYDSDDENAKLVINYITEKVNTFPNAYISGLFVKNPKIFKSLTTQKFSDYRFYTEIMIGLQNHNYAGSYPELATQIRSNLIQGYDQLRKNEQVTTADIEALNYLMGKTFHCLHVIYR